MLELNDHLQMQRWLLENGFMNDLHKDNLFAYGSIVHKDVRGVEVDIDVTNKTVNYQIYIDGSLIKAIALFNELSTATSIIGLWRFRKLVRKEGNLNFHAILNKFVQDYCGPKWKAVVSIRNVKEYEEGFKQKTGDGNGTDQRTDQ